MRQHQHRTGVSAALLVAILLALTGLGLPAAAQPAEPVLRQGPGWSVTQAPAGFRVTVAPPGGVPYRSAYPQITVDGVDVGMAVRSLDARSAEVVTTDPRVLAAADVRLTWPGDRASAGRRRGPAADQPWPAREAGPLLPVDAGTPGRYAVAEREYDLGDTAYVPPALGQAVEVRGRVYAPQGAPGPRPVVVFLHGMHAPCYGEPTGGWPEVPWPCAEGMQPVPNHAGYAQPARLLASHGYVVLSLSANGVNAFDATPDFDGHRARAELVLAHLDLWRRWSTVGGGPFGSRFIGGLDLQRVGLMGHSRGGEGVVRAALLNGERALPYGIGGVLPLAPTDVTRATLPGVPMAVLLPYCDGDVMNLEGQHLFDDTAYAVRRDPAGRAAVLVMGANHNYFNTEWTPGTSVGGAFDDWGGDPASGPCGADSADRLTAAEQQAVGAAYIAGFFRLVLGGERGLLPMFDGSNARVASAGRAVVRVSAQSPFGARGDVARLDTELPAGAVRGAASARVCAGVEVAPEEPEEPGEPGAPGAEAAAPATVSSCARVVTAVQAPHWAPTWLAPGAPPTAVTHLRWSGSDGVLRLDVPPRARDVRQHDALTFRASPELEAAGALDLTVRLVDGRGRAAGVPVSAVGDALVPLPGTDWGLPRVLLRGVRVPLDAFAGVDLSDVRAIEVRTDRVPEGGAYLADLAFAGSSVGRAAPGRLLPRVSVGDFDVAEGDAGTRTVDVVVNLSRPSPVPVRAHLDVIEAFVGELPVSTGVVFAPGSVSVRVPLEFPANTRDSYDRGFWPVVSVPEEAVVGDPLGAGAIRDDDPAPTLTITGAEGREGAGQPLAFPVTLSAPSDKFVTVAVTLADGTAVLGADYDGGEHEGEPIDTVHGSVDPGATEAELPVRIVDDTVAEPVETFTAEVTFLEEAVLSGSGVVTGTIHDDD